MHPCCLLLDEATSMLDPTGCSQVQAILQRLHSSGVTIISATHDMSEAAVAQRVVVLSEGRIALQGSARQVFGSYDTLSALELDLPAPTHIARALCARLPALPCDALTVQELVENIVTLRGSKE